MTELAKRVVVALIAAPLAIALVWLGGLPLAAFLALIAMGAAWELYRMSRAGGGNPLDAAGIALAGLLPIVTYAAVGGIARVPLAAGAVALVALLGASIWARGATGKPMDAVAVTVLGVLYTGGMLSFGIALRYHPYAVGRAAGSALVAMPLVLTWSTDIGAFFVGRAIGGRKLIPAVSPGKTVSGAIGGLLVTILACWLYVRFVLHPVAQLGLTPWGIAIFAILVSVAAQVGDLAESLLKREAGVKDSSHLIPGHGGLLDRLDSLLFVLPVAYLVLATFLIATPL
jgi:phosphatidate cytidylyltransferase